MKIKGSLSDYVIDCLITGFIIFVCFLTLYPFLYCLSYSLSNSVSAMMKNIVLLPIDFTFDNYLVVFREKTLYNAFAISVARTVIGVLYTLSITGMAAYALSKKTLPGNRLIAVILIIPMYVSGGMLPTYVNIYQLKLFNNFLVYILPMGFVTYYMLVMRTFFQLLPESLEESAKLDGAGDMYIFLRIIIPLSAPIIATIALFAGVWQWNSWFDAMVYVTNPKITPMQKLLQQILQQHAAGAMEQAARMAESKKETSPEALQMASLIVSTIPIVCVYPFLQKYFVQGIMIGAVKA